ncbi:MAG TPA: hypothetical protein VK665_01385 [Candidatus Elarobacter sp.]|nr:hypothetical protein [Candidatus Elarobacter sp.]
MNDPLPPDEPRLDYTGRSETAIDYAYYDMPGGAAIVLIDATSGAPLESGSSVLFSGGSGKSSYLIPGGTPAGTYYLGAMSAAGDAVIAQTVPFTIARDG